MLSPLYIISLPIIVAPGIPGALYFFTVNLLQRHGNDLLILISMHCANRSFGSITPSFPDSWLGGVARSYALCDRTTAE